MINTKGNIEIVHILGVIMVDQILDSDYLEERFKPVMRWLKTNERGFQRTLIENTDDLKSVIRELDSHVATGRRHTLNDKHQIQYHCL